MSIDLHIHTTASDGTLSPVETVVMALNLGLRAISITDHDTIDGSRQAAEAGIPQEIGFLTGVEISTTPPAGFSLSGSLHILGYGFDIDNIELNKALALLQEARTSRNPHIISRLNDCGLDISTQEIIEASGGGQAGRPHIAQVMLKKGFVRTIQEAFDKYLSMGRPAYIDKPRINCAEALALITEAGGIAVLAHPILLDLKNNKQLDALVVTLQKLGLAGIEAYYPGQTPEQTQTYTSMAKFHHLLITGGTDFHGSLTPDIKMGTGKGDLSIPNELYEQIMKKL